MTMAALSLSGCLGGGTGSGPAPVIHYGLHGGADSAGMHTVSAGDTLWSIAERYKLAMPDIIYLNKLQPPYAIDPGDRLALPPPSTYKVRPDDTLYGISRTFNVSVTELARLNTLSAPYTIRPGETMRLPSVQPKTVIASSAAVAPAPKPASVRREVLESPLPQPVARSSPAVKAEPVAAGKTISRTPERAAGGRFIWPVDGPVISSYGPKTDGLHNDGINIKAAKGAPVRAAENGVVVYAGNELKGFGNLVLVKHADRWVTAYAHLDRFTVKKGDHVAQGQPIGTVGATGSVDTPQLHFEIRRGTSALNPQAWLARQGT